MCCIHIRVLYIVCQFRRLRLIFNFDGHAKVSIKQCIKHLSIIVAISCALPYHRNPSQMWRCSIFGYYCNNFWKNERIQPFVTFGHTKIMISDQHIWNQPENIISYLEWTLNTEYLSKSNSIECMMYAVCTKIKIPKLYFVFLIVRCCM